MKYFKQNIASLALWTSLAASLSFSSGCSNVDHEIAKDEKHLLEQELEQKNQELKEIQEKLAEEKEISKLLDRNYVAERANRISYKLDEYRADMAQNSDFIKEMEFYTTAEDTLNGEIIDIVEDVNNYYLKKISKLEEDSAALAPYVQLHFAPRPN